MKSVLKGKPLAALIVAKAKPEKDTSDTYDDDDDDGGIKASADEVFTAFKKGSRDAFIEALTSMVEQCVNRVT